MNCRRHASKTGRSWGEFKWLTVDGKEFEYVSEMPETSTSLQLNAFVTLWHLYNPDAPALETPAPLRFRSRAEALRLFPIGFVMWKRFASGTRLKEQVYHFKSPYWRVRCSDRNWEDLIDPHGVSETEGTQGRVEEK